MKNLKSRITDFPKWNPQKSTLIKIEYLDKRIAFKSFRNSCSAFIKNPIVREYLLDKYNNECFLCKSKNNLQVDHILSVYRCFKHRLFKECNFENNLQILCRKCNCSKLP